MLMIKSFAHKGLEKFFKTGSKAGIQAAHEDRLRAQLAKLESSKLPQDMDLPTRVRRRATISEAHCAE